MKVINKIILVIIFILLFIPIYFMLIGSFQDIYGVSAMPPRIIPKNIIIDNYEYILKYNFGIWSINTIIVTVSTILLSILIATTSGYVFSVYNFRFKNILWSLLLIQMMIPRISMLIPLFVIIKDLKLSGSLIATILPNSISPMEMYLARNYFESIPKSIIESARIDGANEWQILKMIIIPVSKPIISVIALFSGVFALQDYIWQMLVLVDESKQTLLVGIMKLVMRRGSDANLRVNPVGRSFAAGILLLFPLVVLFLIGNKYFIEGLQGAVKE